tara:strand:- start:689 stop:1093 length:405 start_codon:yes stop_codon:yes gene_type:complete
MILENSKSRLSLEIDNYEYIFSNDPEEADLLSVQIGIENEDNLFSFSGHAIQRSILNEFSTWLKNCSEGQNYQLGDEGPIFSRTSLGLKIEFYEESHESEDNSLSQVFECETTDLICSSDQIQQQLTKFPSRLN